MKVKNLFKQEHEVSYDICRLLKNGASVKLEEVKRRQKDFTVEKFEESLDMKKGEWKGLKALMVGALTEFKEEKQYIMRKISKNQ